MFGRLPHAACVCTKSGGAQHYKAIFCGLGKRLHAEYGVLSKTLVNRDSTFVAMVGMSQSSTPLHWSVSSCCNPFVEKPIFLPNNDFFDYTSAVTLCGLQAKLNDDRIDGHRTWFKHSVHSLQKLLIPKFKRAEQYLKEREFPLQAVTSILAEQSLREEEFKKEKQLNMVGDPTGVSFGEILRHASLLSGENDSINAERFYKLGWHLGHITYLVDSVQDYYKDFYNKEFNPMFHLDHNEEISAPSPRHKSNILTGSVLPKIQYHHEKIQEIVSQVQFKRYGDLLPSLVGSRFLSKINTDLGDPSPLDNEEKQKSCCGSVPLDCNCFCDCCGCCGDTASSAASVVNTVAEAGAVPETITTPLAATTEASTGCCDACSCCECSCCDC